MNKSLLIGLLILTSAARASAQTYPYTWVLQTTTEVPTNAVRAPAYNGGVSKVACRGNANTDTGYGGGPWAGYLDITSTGAIQCRGASSGSTVVATINVEVLVTTGAQTWVQVYPKTLAGEIGSPLPTNVVSAGRNTRTTREEFLCALGGYVGKVSLGSCSVGAGGLAYSMPATVLTP